MTSITATPATTAASGITARAGATANYEMFLKLLTTQMQNQDPLNPADSTQYTTQLAQFSQVEQAIQQTDALQGILSQLAARDIGQLSNIIGREAEFDTAISGLAPGSPATWVYSGAPDSPLIATITDAAGTVVDMRRLEPASGGRFAWDGLLQTGARARDGAYTLTLATPDGRKIAGRGVGNVTDILAGNGELALNVNGVAMPASALTRVSGASN